MSGQTAHPNPGHNYIMFRCGAMDEWCVRETWSQGLRNPGHNYIMLLFRCGAMDEWRVKQIWSQGVGDAH